MLHWCKELDLSPISRTAISPLPDGLIRSRLLPPYANDARCNLIYFPVRFQVHYMSPTCESLYPECRELMTPADNCLWCARSDSSGYAVAAQQRSICDDGLVLRDLCPPVVTKANHNGSIFQIDGQKFGSFDFKRIGHPGGLTVDVCGDVCILDRQTVSASQILCEVEHPYDCNAITIRGKLRDSWSYELSKRLPRKMLDEEKQALATEQDQVLIDYVARLGNPSNGILTLYHGANSDSTVTMYIGIGGSFAAVLLATMSAAVVIKIMHNRRRMEWEIPLDEISLEEKIGQGTYGVVYKATRRGGPVAVKQLFSSHPTPIERRAFEEEARQLRKLRQPNILGLLGVITKPRLALVTRWCYKSLYDVLHTKKRRIFGKRKVHDFCKQIACGMNFLHSEKPPVLHRDLKSKNVLFIDDSCATLVICDFGLAIKATRTVVESSSDKAKGTVRWMAPEILAYGLRNGPPRYSVRSDVYAFGVCMYELITSRIPFENLEDLQIIHYVGTGARSLRLANNFGHKALVTVMNKCLAYKPEERPDFSEVLVALDAHEGGQDNQEANDGVHDPLLLAGSV